MMAAQDEGVHLTVHLTVVRRERFSTGLTHLSETADHKDLNHLDHL